MSGNRIILDTNIFLYLLSTEIARSVYFNCDKKNL
ncbi:hypothetical protein SAMN05192553_101931 [Cyclobacterium xiamenense]|uniref:PIN domain-containing protein n=1 Tax=Cyclobacterium xiamenense TaxID=1297121 RepID=A0A1H6UW32_9BACT|nr:hypothetical protein SAMN05192553_101931 [Cyclobacterium xiamenense]